MVRIRKRILPLLLACALPALAGSKVYVFYPSLLRPNAIQSALTEKCPGLEVTVFGRLMDFTTMMKQTPPDAVVAPGVVLDQFAGYKQVLKGARKGAGTENMVLVSVDKPVDLSSVAALNVGIVGILERAKLGSFVGDILKSQPKLKNVTKLEDLLPLLTFQNADAILVSEDFVDELKGKSQANLVVTRVPGGKVELVAVAAKDDGVAKSVESAFKSLGAKEKSMLGVDSWNK